MIIRIKIYLCFLVFCLLLAVAGCSNEMLLPDEVPLHVEVFEEEGSLTKPIEPSVEQKACIMYAEAYLDVLTENRFALTEECLSEVQINASGIDLGYGKIAILDIFGDETPELLYIYTDPDVTEFGNSLFLRIYTYSEIEGVNSIFDSRVYSPAGAGNSYCVFLTQDGELVLYYSQSGAWSYYGFWIINPAGNPEYIEYKEFFFCIDNRNMAQLFYDIDYSNKGTTYTQYGEEVTKEDFDKAARVLIGNITQIIFLNHLWSKDGFGLHEDEPFWIEDTASKEISMTYEEAITWLEAQIAKANILTV